MLDVIRYALRKVLGKMPALLTPGTPAPDFEVSDDRGNLVRLSDQRGKRTILWFYPKADTPG